MKKDVGLGVKTYCRSPTLFNQSECTSTYLNVLKEEMAVVLTLAMAVTHELPGTLVKYTKEAGHTKLSNSGVLHCAMSLRDG